MTDEITRALDAVRFKLEKGRYRLPYADPESRNCLIMKDAQTDLDALERALRVALHHIERPIALQEREIAKKEIAEILKEIK